ncbi:hypothetical protein DL98DRAFT_523817 [Cadophora sp. DSE1049]|nr:hypothetical protein DL98DRAFT_523817 [Cadophora sp. DSE1049]
MQRPQGSRVGSKKEWDGKKAEAMMIRKQPSPMPERGRSARGCESWTTRERMPEQKPEPGRRMLVGLRLMRMRMSRGRDDLKANRAKLRTRVAGVGQAQKMGDPSRAHRRRGEGEGERGLTVQFLSLFADLLAANSEVKRGASPSVSFRGVVDNVLLRGCDSI